MKRILHFRLANEQGNPAPRGGMTVAIIPDDGFIRVGVALCHPVDSYDKRRGRQQAEGRAFVGWPRHGEGPLQFAITPEGALAGAARGTLQLIPGTCTWRPYACRWAIGGWEQVIDRIVQVILLTAEKRGIAVEMRTMTQTHTVAESLLSARA